MSTKIACHGCDLLIELPVTVEVKSKLSCPRCMHTITRGHTNAIDYTISIALSSLIALILSYSFSFISFETQGQFREISLIQATLELYNLEHYFLALLVFVLTIAFPLLYLLLLLGLLIPIKFFNTVNRDNSTAIVGILNKLIPWLMVDVFLIGVLVAIIKMWSLASLSFGISFWSYIMFVLLFSYVLYIVDNHKLWQWVNDAE